MRQHNHYLGKVQEELSIYQQYLLDETIELTPTQLETWERIDAARAWLRTGYSDSDALKMLKNTRNVQERRAREILSMAYEVFAELRAGRSKEGVKFLYAEIFRKAAFEAKSAGDFMSFGILMDKAAKADGAYDNSKGTDVESKKKPQKVTIKVKNLTLETKVEPKQIQDASHEIIP